MASTESEELAVQVSKDQMTATMVIPAGFPVDMLTPEVCAAQFEANRVLLAPRYQKQIHEAVLAYLATPSEKMLIKLIGRAPIKGEDGSLELAPECRRPQPGQLSAEVAQDDEAASSVDHYARSPYILVERDQVIGRIIPPTDGEDGVDVLGNAVPARPGKSFVVKPHESILVDARNNLIAQCDGTLEHYDTTVRVNKLLKIDGNVDFETGNINFDGDVEIGKGICDNFKVTAAHSAVIAGVVEAAELSTGIDLTLVTGMFGKDKGVIHVDRDCRAKFLQQTRGKINGKLIVDREIMNCDLIVGGGIESPHASLIGGTYHTLGSDNMKNIGSEAGSRTLLHLGSSPDYTRRYNAAIQKLEQLQLSCDKRQQKLDQLNMQSNGMDSESKEMVTALWCEQLDFQDMLEQLKKLTAELTEKFNNARCAHVTVLSMIYPETVLVHENTCVEFVKPLRGPVTIRANSLGELCYQRESGGPLQSLQGIARTTHLSKLQ